MGSVIGSNKDDWIWHNRVTVIWCKLAAENRGTGVAPLVSIFLTPVANPCSKARISEQEKLNIVIWKMSVAESDKMETDVVSDMDKASGRISDREDQSSDEISDNDEEFEKQASELEKKVTKYK